MSEVLVKTEDEQILAPYFNCFDANFTLPVLNFFEEFWEQNFKIKLVSITKNPNIKKDKIPLGETYFSKNVNFGGKTIIIRLNINLIQMLIEESLGVQSSFNPSNLTKFEMYLLGDFAKKLVGFLSPKFIPIQNIEKKYLKLEDNWNLTYYIKMKGKKIGKLVMSVPEYFIRPQKFKSKTEFNVSDAFHTKLRVKVGSTKLMLNELKELNIDDIILLENSLINKMTIKSGDFSFNFRVNPDPSIMVELDEEEHDIGSKKMSNKNMWDDIQIEVSAEFDKVKMTLGELKQISAGMVIDLADAFNGKLSLVVEDKTVARGNLVIINERYGIKLTEVFSEEKKPEPQPQTIKEVKPTKVEEVKSDIEEDFDYSDFEEDNKQ